MHVEEVGVQTNSFRLDGLRKLRQSCGLPAHDVPELVAVPLRTVLSSSLPVAGIGEDEEALSLIIIVLDVPSTKSPNVFQLNGANGPRRLAAE